MCKYFSSTQYASKLTLRVVATKKVDTEGWKKWGSRVCCL
jgi:hypothetical protein